MIKILTLKNVSAGYGEIDVVKNVSFEVKNNENLSIIGPNGCGKTTLLKTIVNLIKCRGDIEIDGVSLNKMKPHELAKKISMLSQTSGIYFSYSVFDTVMMGRYLHLKDRFLGKPSNKDKIIVDDCLKALNLIDVSDKNITHLSGGQLQRVFLARTLAQEPEIILLDEPTNHLDLKYQIELVEYLNEWSKKENHTVIGVLHDINLAMKLSDNIMVMKDGEIIAYGNVENEITGDLLKNVYEIDVSEYMINSLDKWRKIKDK